MRRNKTNIILFVICLFISTNGWAQWNYGTNTATTTNNVGINNTNPTSNLVIGTPDPNSPVTTNTTKVSILEENPWIELKDASGTYMGANGNVGGIVGIRLISPSGTTEISNGFTGALGNVTSFKLIGTSSSPGYHIQGSTLWIGGAGATVNGAINFTENSQFSGTVGIGTSCIPTGYKLAVDGKIMCEEVMVKMSDASGCWPDYVFSSNYKLKSLKELEQYIDKNKHLPNVPSEEEVKANGVSTGEMFKIQMEKIEELNLYMIEMNKQLEQLKKENEELKKMMKAKN